MAHAEKSHCELFYTLIQSYGKNWGTKQNDTHPVSHSPDGAPITVSQLRNAKTGCEMQAIIGSDNLCRCGAPDEKFLIKDKNNRPLVKAYYSAKMPTGEIIHGETDDNGYTKRFHTDQLNQTIKIYIGHIEKSDDVQPIVSAPSCGTPQSTVEIKIDRLWKPWSASWKLLPFLGEWESGVLNGHYKGLQVIDGMILTVYLDSKQIPTVGCGHVILPSDNLKLGETVTLERAKKFLKNDLKIMEKAVNTKFKIPLHQYEYDALVAITFNAGPGEGLDGLADYLNKGRYQPANEFIKTYRARGNEKRRVSEGKLFESGVYDAKH